MIFVCIDYAYITRWNASSQVPRLPTLWIRLGAEPKHENPAFFLSTNKLVYAKEHY